MDLPLALGVYGGQTQVHYKLSMEDRSMFTFIRNLIAANKKTLKNNVGATMIEYAMVVAAIVAVAAIAFTTTGTGTIDGAITTKLGTVATSINATPTQ